MNHDLILNRYRPIAFGGEGASGTVEICWDTRIQRRVAIKRLPVRARTQPGPIPGLAEARTAALLSRPSIVSVIDFETTGEEAYLIMEAIEGPSLSDLIDDDPDHMLSLDAIAAVTQAVGDALDYAHDNQVLHLDIKPDNILITHAGQVKVSDFGVSELAGAGGFGSAVGGTIGYMPPEQMLSEDLDQRCDEFALAAVVYEMLTGECPFYARSIDESLRLIADFNIEAPSAFRDDTDSELDEVLLAALDPDPNERFETVLDFLDALEPLLGDAASGTRELRALATPDDERQPESGESERPRARARIDSRIVMATGRVAVFVACWLACGMGITQSGLIDTPLAFAIAVLVGTLGAAAPLIGVPSALVVLGAGLVAGAGTQAATVHGAAWIAAGAAVALFGLRKTRAATAVGVVLACALVAASYLAVP